MPNISFATQISKGTSSGLGAIKPLSRADKMIAARTGYHNQTVNGKNYQFPVKDQITSDLLNGISATMEGATPGMFDKATEGIYFDDKRRNAYYNMYMGKSRQDFQMSQAQFLKEGADVLDFLETTYTDVSSKVLVISPSNGQQNHLPRFFGTNYVVKSWNSNKLIVTQATINHAISTNLAVTGATTIPASLPGQSTTIFLEYAGNSPLTDCKACYCSDNSGSNCGVGVRQAIHQKTKKTPVSALNIGLGQSFASANDNSSLGWIIDIKHGFSFTSNGVPTLGALITTQWGYGKGQPTCDVNGNATGFSVGMPKSIEKGDFIFYSDQYVPLGDCDIKTCCGGCIGREVEERECDYLESRKWCAYEYNASDTINDNLMGLTGINESIQKAVRLKYLGEEEFNAKYETVFARPNYEWGMPFGFGVTNSTNANINPEQIGYNSCLTSPTTRTSFVNHMESPHTSKMAICFEKLGSPCEEQLLGYVLNNYFSQLEGETMTLVGDIDSLKLQQSLTANEYANIKFGSDKNNSSTATEMLIQMLANTSGMNNPSFSGQLPKPNGIDLFNKDSMGKSKVTIFEKEMDAIHDTLLSSMYPGRIFIHNANRRHKFTSSNRQNVESTMGKLSKYIQESGMFIPALTIEGIEPIVSLSGNVEYRARANCNMKVTASQKFGNYAEAKMLSKGAILDLYIKEKNPIFDVNLPVSPTNLEESCVAFSQSSKGCIPIYRKAQSMLEYNR